MHIFLTGATGFIGRVLCRHLEKTGAGLTCVMQKPAAGMPDNHFLGTRRCFVGRIGAHTDFGGYLEQTDVVIHAAGCAHMPTRSDYDMLEMFFEVNLHATKNLALQAAQKGVRRFVYISSAAVMGRSSSGRPPFCEKDVPAPYNSYTLSKFRAEQELETIAEQTGMEVVILRPPLVYGPGVKANFLKLLDLVHTGLPLPFAGINNARSFICLDNLMDIIEKCAVHANIGSRTFLVSDGNPISTPQLLTHISAAMGKKPRMFAFPPHLVRSVLTFLGKKGIYDRLWGDMSLDTGKIQKVLGWHPVISADAGILQTVDWYVNRKNATPKGE